jgi:putative heme-binding domain-containing protein
MLRITALLAISAVMPRYVAAQQESETQPGEASPANALGQGIFRTQCAACHGLDGRGGEHAPSIVRDQVKSLSDEDLTGIVHNGILRKGMPEFSSLGSAAIKSVVAYLRELQGTAAPEAVAGDATRGRALFFGKAECSLCHVVQGVGNFIAADLSDYGRHHRPSEIRSAILKPGKLAGSALEQVTVTTRSGAEFSGVLRNEDNFSLQIQEPPGSFYLIMKADAARVTRKPVRAMPSDYSKRLTSQEIDDLVSVIAKGSSK